MKRIYYLRGQQAQVRITNEERDQLLQYLALVRLGSGVRSRVGLWLWRCRASVRVQSLVLRGLRRQGRGRCRSVQPVVSRAQDILGLVLLWLLRVALSSVALGNAFAVLRALLS
jgi:hypothetical protein